MPGTGLRPQVNMEKKKVEAVAEIRELIFKGLINGFKKFGHYPENNGQPLNYFT